MIADIIPTKKLPKNLSILSYHVPQNLKNHIKVGQLANIPLRRSTTSGVIYRLYTKSKPTNYVLKNILSLNSQKPIFTPLQLKLFTKLAENYYVSTSLFVRFNLPKLIKEDWRKIYSPTPTSFKKPSKAKIEYFWWHTIQDRNKFYKQQIDSSVKQAKQILLVVPRINHISCLAEELKLKNTAYVAVHRQLSRKQNALVWIKILNGKALIIIGTRSSLFYPFVNLKTIIIDSENSLDHKQYDMNPRYEVKRVAQEMHQLYKTHLVLSSASPSLLCYSQFKLKSISQNRKKLAKHYFSIIDLKNELAKKNYSFISDHLYSQIKNSLNSKKSVFLFVNKKGQSSATICRDCNYAFNCPHCQLPLIKNEQNQFICYTCNYSEEVPPFCPRCSGPNLRSSGIGIQKIEAALKKLLPKANVVRLDKDINNQSPVSQTGKIEPKQSINHQPAKLKKLSQNKASIIIGTAFALDKIAWPQIDLLGIINADQLWQHIEFMANETAYQLMIKLLTLAPKNAKFIIQTFSPEHHLLKSIIKNNPAIFYEKELKFRKQFNYPPFVYLIKLSCLNKSELKTKKQAQKIYRLLKKTIANKNSIYPPLPILRKKIRGKYKYNLILKINKIDDFGHLTKFVPNNWLIDIQARTLLD